MEPDIKKLISEALEKVATLSYYSEAEFEKKFYKMIDVDRDAMRSVVIRYRDQQPGKLEKKADLYIVKKPVEIDVKLLPPELRDINSKDGKLFFSSINGGNLSDFANFLKSIEERLQMEKAA